MTNTKHVEPNATQDVQGVGCVGDFISRQVAIEALGERPMSWCDTDYELGQRNQYDLDVLALVTVPSADVRENVHGEWIHKYTHESLHDRTGIWCSACGKDALQDSEGYYIEDCETDFCPFCGADLRGGKP